MPTVGRAPRPARVPPDPPVSLCTRGASRVSSQSGFALLFVYAMAAAVAITLFMELPRVAFEAQRDKEQLLIDRGEQYTRAINLYVRKFNRYPADFDALSNTQNMRFLRHKYVDPMTGKDDWRIVHVGPGGVFTDSLVYNQKKNTSTSGPQNFITEMQQTGGNQTSGNSGGVNIGLRQRQSDQAGAPGDLNNPGLPPMPGAGAQPTAPVPSTEPVMVLPDGRIVPVSQGMAVLSGQTPQQPGQPGQPGRGGVPGQPNGAPFPNNNATPPGFQQAQPNQNLQGAVPGQPTPPPAAAANLINQLLTTPRPGGLNGPNGTPQQPTVDANGNPVNPGAGGFNIPATPGFGNTQQAAGTNNTGTPIGNTTGGQTIGGGIAGVASKREQEGIKSYKDKTNYKEWEFVYDITKDPLRTGGAAAAATSANQNQANPNGTTNPNNPFGTTSPSPFGTSSPSPFGGVNPGANSPSTPPPPPPPQPGMTPQ